MSEIMTTQDFVDGRLDTQTLKEAVNEDKIITARLGREYASVPMASRLFVESGLLGATPYTTFEKMIMEGAASEDGSYAVVTNDPIINNVDKNGFYQKTAGAWIFLNWNPIVQSKVYTDEKIDSSISELDISATTLPKNELGFDVMFAFADDDGKIGATIDAGGNIDSNNLQSTKNYGVAIAFLDDNGKVGIGIDYAGNIINPQIDRIESDIAALKDTTPSDNTGNLKILSNAKTDYMHLFSYGQSLSRGVRSVPAISTTQPHANVTFNSGVLYRADEVHDYSNFKPLISELNDNNEAESPATAFANHFVDYRIADGDTANQWQMVATSPGLGGTPIIDLIKGSSLYTGMIAQVQAAYDVAQSKGKSYSVWGTAWTQGEADEARQTSQKDYTAMHLQMHKDFADDVSAITGQKFRPPMVTYQPAACRRYNRDLKIPMALLEASENVDDIILACPIYQLEKSTDDLHLLAESSKQLGLYYAKALNYTLFTGQKWQPVKPISVIAQGRIIDITYIVQSGTGLQFDTSAVSARPNQGFDIWVGDTVSDIISSVTIVDDNRIRIILNADIPLDANLCYARGRVGDAQPLGNLRDNEGMNDNYVDNLDVTRYMHNWSVMFQTKIK